jgi:hypothetical protein
MVRISLRRLKQANFGTRINVGIDSDLIDLRKLRRKEPLFFARICKKAGYKEEAFKIYLEKKVYAIAAELAYELGRYSQAKELVEKARQSAEQSLIVSRSNASRSGGLGAAMSFGNAEDWYKEQMSKFDKLEEKIDRKLICEYEPKAR